MADMSLRIQEEGTGEGRQSPPAPPPSPEYPAHTMDLNQFDFSALLLNNTTKKDHYPSSLLSSQPTTSLSYNHQSPPLSRQESGTTSPSWNESGSFHSHSPFFLPSPEHYSSERHLIISDPPSPIASNSMPPNRGDLLLANFHEAAHCPDPMSHHVLSISLPVNGELQQLGPHPLFSHIPRDHTPFLSLNEDSCSVVERKRKISLKRSHEQSSQEVWSNSYDPQTYIHNDLNVINNKKLCSDFGDIRDRESREYNNHTHRRHHRSPSPQQRVRSYTHSGVPLNNDFNRLSLARGRGDGLNNVTLHSHSLQNHTLQNHAHHQSGFQGISTDYNNLGVYVGSHVIPQATATVGFVMTENHTHNDVPMETGDVGGMTTPSNQTTRISITKADSIEYNSMDTGHTHLSSNKTFSFSLGSSNNLTSDHLHPHVGGVFNQATPTSHSPNELFSHSL